MAPSTTPLLHQHASRTASFTKKRPATQRALRWPFTKKSSLAPDALASAGFHHCPTEANPLRTRCFLCACEVDDWAEGDDPIGVHLEAAPACAWVVVKSEEWGGLLPREEWAAIWGEDGSGWPKSERWVRAREETFEGVWPHEGEAGFKSGKEFAAAGWTFQAEEGDGGDRCVCPFCARSVEFWEPADDPL